MKKTNKRMIYLKQKKDQMMKKIKRKRKQRKEGIKSVSKLKDII